MKKIIALLFIAASAAAAQNINPITQITWPRVTGSGAPSLTCGSIEYGMPYTDLSQNPAVNYHCTTHGWQTDGGGGSVGPGTVGFIPKFATTTTINNSHIDDSATTASTVTITEPVVVNSGGSTAGWFDVIAGTDPGGASGHARFTSDSTNGYAEVNENNGGRSRVCTAANGICQPPTTFQTGGVNNSSQTALNLVEGTNVTITNTSGGNVMIAASGGGGSGAATNITSAITWVATPATLTVTNGQGTLSANTASLAGNSLPTGYNRIEIRIWGRGDNASTSAVLLELNGDATTGDYECTVSGSLSGASSNFTCSSVPVVFYGPMLSATGQSPGSGEIEIQNYTVSSTQHGLEARGGRQTASNWGTFNVYGTWTSGSATAITSFTLVPIAGNFDHNEFTISVYGWQ